MDVGMLLVIGAVGGLIGMMFGSGRKIGGGGGFVIGFLFGPIGWILAALSPRAEPEPLQVATTSVLDRIERRHEAPGWYPDPLGRFSSRWFDGTRWTQHVGRVEADGSHTQLEDPL